MKRGAVARRAYIYCTEQIHTPKEGGYFLPELEGRYMRENMRIAETETFRLIWKFLDRVMIRAETTGKIIHVVGTTYL